MKNNYSLILLALLLSLGFSSTAQKKMSNAKKSVVQSVEDHRAELINISDEIWELAETAFEENESSKILADYAEQQGFKVEERSGVV